MRISHYLCLYIDCFEKGKTHLIDPIYVDIHIIKSYD